jgi:NTP pyrophosphatase (non-canonical NTP hydrolase)
MTDSSLSQLSSEIKKFNKDRDWEQFHTPKNLASAVVVEASELLEHFLWTKDKDTQAFDQKKLGEIKEEVGDVLICLVNFADKLGIDLIEAAQQKLIKNGKNYPIEKSKGSSKRHTEL